MYNLMVCSETCFWQNHFVGENVCTSSTTTTLLICWKLGVFGWGDNVGVKEEKTEYISLRPDLMYE
jgi:hypothetical protein